MERLTKRITLPALAALAMLGACTGGGSGASSPAPETSSADDAAWMDTALVQVVTDPAAHRETVVLVDQASGTSRQVEDEAVTDEVVEVEDPQ